MTASSWMKYEEDKNEIESSHTAVFLFHYIHREKCV